MNFNKSLTLMSTILSNFILENNMRYSIIGEEEEKYIYLNENGFYEIINDEINYVSTTLVVYIILVLIYSKRNENRHIENIIVNNTYINDPKIILTNQQQNFKSYIDAYYKINLNHSNIINIKNIDYIRISKRLKSEEKIRITALASFEYKVLELYIKNNLQHKKFSFENFLLDMIDASNAELCESKEIINEKNNLFK